MKYVHGFAVSEAVEVTGDENVGFGFVFSVYFVCMS